MIELINVSKYYMTDFGRHYVFRNVSLRLPLDKSVAVIGPNGAGKSTFLRLLGGADIPSEGRILKTGRISPPMGLTPGLQSSLTGAENARFAGRIYGMDRDEIAKLIEFVRQLANIGKFFDMPVHTYSAGMKQRVSFAINMSMTFDYYLFDEVGAGGDREFRKSAKALIEQRLKTSKFIIVSHRRDELLDICDSGIVIRDGTLTFYDDIKDALAAYNTDDDESPQEERKAKRRSRKGKPEPTPEELAAKEERKSKRLSKKTKLTATPEELAAQKEERKSKRRSKKAKPEPTPDELAAKEERKSKRLSKKAKPEPTPEELAQQKEDRKSKRQSKKAKPESTPEELALEKEQRKSKRRSRKASAVEAGIPDHAAASLESIIAAPAAPEFPAPDETVPPGSHMSRRDIRRARKRANVAMPEQPLVQDASGEPSAGDDQAATSGGGTRREARRAKRRARKDASAASEDTAVVTAPMEPPASGADLKAERKRQRVERRKAAAEAPDDSGRSAEPLTGEPGQLENAITESGVDQHIIARELRGHT